ITACPWCEHGVEVDTVVDDISTNAVVDDISASDAVVDDSSTNAVVDDISASASGEQDCSADGNLASVTKEGYDKLVLDVVSLSIGDASASAVPPPMKQIQEPRRKSERIKRRPANMQQQVVGDRDLNEEQLFNQLFKARLGHPPYDKYESWYDIALWEEIVKELGSRSLFHNPTITDVLKVVIKYYKEYKSDPELIQKWLSHSLRLNIRHVFDSFTDKYGSLTFDALETVHSRVRPQSSLSGEIIEYKNDAQALEELLKVCEEKARRILPSTSDRMGIREYRKERGFAGPVEGFDCSRNY
ncbi:hypothetical protein KIW84_076849, partial [Lathyrus oleraceus]